MAAIRIPASAEPLLPYCRSSGSNGPHVWETYADLVAFLAAYGYSQDMDPPDSFTAAKSTNPIDLSTFRNRGLYPQLLMIAIAASRGWIVAKSPDEICSINERYAAVGAVQIGFFDGEQHPSTIFQRLIEIMNNISSSKRKAIVI
jgi:hypothetical protein